MGLSRNVEIIPLKLVQGGSVSFYSPQTSDQTIFVEVAPGTIDDMFCHHYQTDQLSVVRGSLILVILQDKKYKYLPLSQCERISIKIPPGVPHAAINLSPEPCWVVNALIRHGSPHPKDYVSLRPPLEYDLDLIKELQNKLKQVCL